MMITPIYRRVQVSALSGILAAAAWLLYRFPPAQSDFYPVCPIHAWTGLFCPGCGGTRAFAALVHGHLAEAFHWNPLLTLLLPALALYLGLAIRRGRWPQLRPSAIHALLIVTVLFTIYRNIT
jgi:Protein of unknown function (DUF2752)